MSEAAAIGKGADLLKVVDDKNVATLTALSTYPVKSLGGGAHRRAEVQPWGLGWDRRWMVVDEAGRFLTQRDHPQMALLHANAAANALTLSAPCIPDLTIPADAQGVTREVRIWRDAVAACDVGQAAADWLSAAIGHRCRLVHLADPTSRALSPAYAQHAGETVNFADGFPVLLTSMSSLADLNARLENKVPMARFRPNLVIEGAPPWVEDTWRRVRIGAVVFRVAKPCDRCIVTTIDPQTGLRPDGNEPLRTLSMFRRSTSGSVMFGQNLVPESRGSIGVGDKVEIIEQGGSNVFIK